jgi:hypothetical protein
MTLGEDSEAAPEVQATGKVEPPAGPQSGPSSLAALAREVSQPLWTHLPLAITLAGFILAILKVSRVADGDLTTALALIRSAGASTILLGVFVPVMRTLFYLLIWWGMLSFIYEKGTLTQRRIFLELAPVLSLLIIITFPHGFDFLAVGIMWVVLIAVLLLHRKKKAEWLSVLATFSVAPTVLATFFITSTPWMPPERIATSSRGNIVGYVVSDENKWFTILVDQPRHVILLPSRDVVGRTICKTAAETVTCPSPSPSATP